MTSNEFKQEYKRLCEFFTNGSFDSDARAALIFEVVQDLDAQWWARLVNRMIRQNDSRFNIEDAARAERIAKHDLRLTQDVRHTLRLAAFRTEHGLQNFLKQIGAHDVIDAVRKVKQAK